MRKELGNTLICSFASVVNALCYLYHHITVAALKREQKVDLFLMNLQDFMCQMKIVNNKGFGNILLRKYDVCIFLLFLQNKRYEMRWPCRASYLTYLA